MDDVNPEIALSAAESVLRCAIVVSCSVLIVGGVVGNLVSAVVFHRSHVFGQRRYRRLLILLAACDVASLVIAPTRYWYRQVVGRDFRLVDPVVGRLHQLAVYLCLDASHLLLLVIGIDRLLSIVYPLVRGAVKTRVCLLMLAGISTYIVLKTALNVRVARTMFRANTSRSCFYPDRAKFVPYLEFAVDSATTVVIVLCNVIVVRTLTKRRTGILDCLGGGTTSRIVGEAAVSAKTFLALSILQFVTTSPSTIIAMLDQSILPANFCLRTATGAALLYDGVHTLMFMNNALNFIVYCSVSARFRRHVRLFLCDRRGCCATSCELSWWLGQITRGVST